MARPSAFACAAESSDDGGQWLVDLSQASTPEAAALDGVGPSRPSASAHVHAASSIPSRGIGCGRTGSSFLSRRGWGGWSSEARLAVDQQLGRLSFRLTEDQASNSSQNFAVENGIVVACAGPGRPQAWPGVHRCERRSRR